MSAITFKAKPYKIGSWTVLRLPQEESLKLPSRGQVMVRGAINGHQFQAALEPDGNGSHWLHIDKTMQKAAEIVAGDMVALELDSMKEWPEPTIPADIKATLAANPQIKALWMDTTPLARWEWIRWIGSTSQQETRKRRIEVACSKLRAGERRPCCFNRSMCCVPQVSKNGVLLDPDA